VGSAFIRDKIPDVAAIVRNFIAGEIKGKFVSIKMDGVTLRNREFMGINIQFIQEAKVVVRTLAVCELFSRHTALNLKSDLLSTLDRYLISVSDLLTSTTDSGANYLKIGELLRLDQMSELDALEWFPEWQDGLLQVVRCLAHSMQLAITDALKLPKYVALFDAFRVAVKYCRKPSVARLLKAQGLPVPVLDVVTRWGSSFDMAESVQKVKGFLKEDEAPEDMTEEGRKGDEQKQILTDEEWNRLDEVVEALRPAREATRAVQAEQLLPGDFYAEWFRCKLRTQKVDSDLARAIVENLTAREKGKVNKKGEERVPSLFEYPGFLAGMLLDPRYFSILEGNQIKEAKEYLTKVWARLQAKKLSPETSPSMHLDQDLHAFDREDSDSELEEFLKGKREELSEVSTPDLTISLLIDTYLKTTKPMPRKSKNVLEFWESQRLISPTLYELSQIVLAIPLTQVTVERLFSSLNFILNPLRLNLTTNMVDDLLVMHSNSSVLEEPSVIAQIRDLLLRSTSKTSECEASSSSAENVSSEY